MSGALQSEKPKNEKKVLYIYNLGRVYFWIKHISIENILPNIVLF